jgi:glycosyltransferase involved in cell wall biosynthesis
LQRPLLASIRVAAPKLLVLVTEDWFFCSSRLPMTRAARDAGFDVVVATRVRDHGEQIRGEGFALRPLPWRRRGDGFFGGLRAILAIARLYRAERPDIVYHVALKAIVFGAAATWLAFPWGGARPTPVSAVTGLGAVLDRVARRWGSRFHPLAIALRLATRRGVVTVENPDNRDVLVKIGLDPARISLIRGCGVDTVRFASLPEPQGPAVTMALVARMLRSKGVLDAAAAVRQLRAEGRDINLILAGATDPDNRDSLSDDEMRALAAEPGVEWLGHVADVRNVWRRADIAVLPSTYGEGLPAVLLEAASCGRPIITSNMPGCREAVMPGETGLLVPARDVAALSTAIAMLAENPDRRRAMGCAGRALVEREFSNEIVAAKTLTVYRSLLPRAEASK